MPCAMSTHKNFLQRRLEVQPNLLCSPLNLLVSCGCYWHKQPFLRNSRKRSKSRKQQREQTQTGRGERNKVIAAFNQGIPRREICSYLRWGNAKYSTIVKPVLDSYEQQAGTQEQETPC